MSSRISKEGKAFWVLGSINKKPSAVNNKVMAKAKPKALKASANKLPSTAVFPKAVRAKIQVKRPKKMKLGTKIATKREG